MLQPRRSTSPWWQRDFPITIEIVSIPCFRVWGFDGLAWTGGREELRGGWISLLLRLGHCRYKYLLKVTSHFHLFLLFVPTVFEAGNKQVNNFYRNSAMILSADLGTVKTNGLLLQCCISSVSKLFLSFPNLKDCELQVYLELTKQKPLFCSHILSPLYYWLLQKKQRFQEKKNPLVRGVCLIDKILLLSKELHFQD